MDDSKIAATSRQSNIELLRILAAMGVIILHYNNPGIGGAFKHVIGESANYYALIVLESAFICAVDLFMIISGYFMCKKLSCKLSKPIELLAQLMIFELILYVLKVISGEGIFSWNELLGALLPTNYFVVLYVVTFILSPYINLLISKLNKKQLRLLVGILFLLFSVQAGALNMISDYTDISVYGASNISIYGDQGGYNIVNFIMCYMIGAGIRNEIFKAPKPAICTIVYLIIVYVIYQFRLWNYNEPFVIVEAVTLFVLFSQLKIKNNAIINKIARASFTVYLLHETFVVRTGIKGFVTSGLYKMLGHIAVVAIAIYLICFVVYLVWEKITRPIYNCIWKKIGVPEINLETA